jgi:hypothetical protein
MASQQLLHEFIDFVKRLKGDEKGEAQLFCDRLFRAFGHGGIIEANGALETRIKFSESGRTKFADCLWSPEGKEGVLIEMKKRGEKNLESHFPQVRDYWIEMNPEKVIGARAQKPKYIILCNFDRFIIYKHLTFVDEISIEEFIDRASAFNFLLSEDKEPIFHNNVEAISQDAARTIGEIFKHFVFKKVSRLRSRKDFYCNVFLPYSQKILDFYQIRWFQKSYWIAKKVKTLTTCLADYSSKWQALNPPLAGVLSKCHISMADFSI